MCSAVLQVREIANRIAPEPFRWTAEGLLALQEVGRSWLFQRPLWHFGTHQPIAVVLWLDRVISYH
jgi:hypothetical protein